METRAVMRANARSRTPPGTREGEMQEQTRGTKAVRASAVDAVDGGSASEHKEERTAVHTADRQTDRQTERETRGW